MGQDRLGEILDLMDSKDFSKDRLKKYTYAHLDELLQTSKALGNMQYFIKISQRLYQENMDRLKKQDKVVVAFLLSSASIWYGEEICQLMRQSDKFEPYIVVVGNFYENTVDTEEYINTYKIMKEKGDAAVLGTIDFEKGKQLNWDELGIEPDIIFCPSPYPLQRLDYNFYNFTLDKLIAYTPYGITGVSSQDDLYEQAEYNQPMHNMAWKIFSHCQDELLMAEKCSDIGNINMVFSGYTKMDKFYNKEIGKDVNEIWKIPETKSIEEVTKIIYAPHHTLPGTVKHLSLSTFEKNGMFMYELAKKYTNTTWIIRPHPQLGMRCVDAGLYSSIDEYIEYLDMWEKLPNARVSRFGEYSDIFKTSDGMIMDCGSFLGEYLYVNKPLLFLRSEGAGFNAVGEKYMEVYDAVPGDDFAGIENFVNNVLEKKQDTKFELRKKLFDECFDYVAYNGKSASEFIVEYLNKMLS